jgi:copper(I)-binding protein
LAALALALCASGLAACGPGAPTLRIENAEYRAPLGTSEIGVAYFSITSASADRIVGISSPQANSIEMHASVTEGSRTSMKRLDAVDLPAGKTVTFGPKGMHLMVFTPKPLPAGATFPMQIALQSGRIETVPFHPALSQR